VSSHTRLTLTRRDRRWWRGATRTTMALDFHRTDTQPGEARGPASSSNRRLTGACGGHGRSRMPGSCAIADDLRQQSHPLTPAAARPRRRRPRGHSHSPSTSTLACGQHARGSPAALLATAAGAENQHSTTLARRGPVARQAASSSRSLKPMMNLAAALRRQQALVGAVDTTRSAPEG